MAGYRLYFLDAKGAIQARQDFGAENDSKAQTIGSLLWQACSDCYEDYELWQANRCLERGDGTSHAIPKPAPVCMSEVMQTSMLELEERLLDSHWRVAHSKRLLAATEALRRSLNGDGLTAAVTHQDIVRYICGKTGTKMMSLQLAQGMRLILRGSRGFDRMFDEFFAVVVPTGHCACGVAFENGRQIVVPAINSSPIFAGKESLEVLRAQGVASCVSTPLVDGNGRITGMFSFHRETVWNPLNGELAQLRHIANDIAIAMADPRSAEAQMMRAAG